MAGVACASSLMRQAMSSSVRWPTSAGVAIALRGASRPLSAANGKPCDHPLIRPSAAHHAAYRSRLEREFDSRLMDRQRMRSPLGRARGLGSAREGVEVWWMQRVTAVALLPLTLWFVASLIALTGSDYNTFIAWLKAPFVAILMVLLLIALFYHTALGL